MDAAARCFVVGVDDAVVAASLTWKQIESTMGARAEFYHACMRDGYCLVVPRDRQPEANELISSVFQQAVSGNAVIFALDGRGERIDIPSKFAPKDWMKLLKKMP